MQQTLVARARIDAPAGVVLQTGELVLRTARPGTPRPVELPPRPTGFVGRIAEIAAIARAAAPAGSPRGLLVTGRPGVGKTALAVEAGHRLAELFGDGVLWVEPGRPPTTHELAGRLLRSLGVAEVPRSPDRRLAAYHRALGERRALVVFDDVATADPVLPLLPAAGHSFALLTSRAALPDLVPVARLRLGDLDAADAHRLLTTAARLPGGPGTWAELVRLCTGLPLALRIAAARLADEPDLSPARLGTLLSGEPRTLCELRAGDQALGTRFGVSYDRLGPAERIVFRRLGAVPPCDLTTGCAAALAGGPPEVVAPLLDRLDAAHLVDAVPAAGEHRYRLHDLLHTYAGQRLRAAEPPVAVAAARRRLAHQRVGHRADRTCHPGHLAPLGGRPSR
ncbi:NB-ARC domain-containing protein [Pseudonocardia bannensis]|uniref:NB-ARC domain-containing protein n=1 Tax=Pseudonocardia bannensis TaxID=630973 RepID=A0A848DBM0_9PSEU|nr:AAA family ATPase [Pseudonocardia bannensis]NMH90177.1 hypothetical protein [Pseudonocardia bannensis]